MIIDSLNLIKTPQDLNKWMNKNIKYKEFTKLQSPKETRMIKAGSCHDQVVFEYEYLKKMVPDINTIFFIEADNNDNGGMTHSFIIYKTKDSNKYFWFENAAPEWRGIKEFNSINNIKDYIISEHKKNNWGDYKKYPNVYFGYFKGKVGDSLQDIVIKSLNKER